MMFDRVARSARIAFASLAVTTALAGAAPALAITPMTPTYTESYTFDTQYTLSNAVTVNTYIPYDDGTGGGEGFVSGGPYSSNGPGVVTLVDPFLKENNIASTFFMGTSSLDTGSPNHLIIAVNPTFASSAVGNSFETVFGGSYSEDQVIGALNGLYNPGSDQAAHDSAVDTIFGFSSTVLSADSAGFAPNGGAFTLLGFSDGQIVGFGSTALASAAPEPAGWAMMIGGFGLVGGTMRRRRTIGIAARRNAAA